MKSNIISIITFLVIGIGVTIVKIFYTDDYHFAFVEQKQIDEIRKIEDIEHLRSVTIGYIAINDHQVKSYNSLFDNSLYVMQILCFLGFIFSVGAQVGSKNDKQHPNKQLHEERKKRAL
jgi:hypothetical protein